MEEPIECSPEVLLTSAVCRTCATNKEVNCCIYEAITDDSESTSLHMMLGTLFPALFNNEPEQNYETMHWPSRICESCKGKIIEAYSLYKLCAKSTQEFEKLFSFEQVEITDIKTENVENMLEDNHSVICDEIELACRNDETYTTHEDEIENPSINPSPQRANEGCESIKMEKDSQQAALKDLKKCKEQHKPRKKLGSKKMTTNESAMGHGYKSRDAHRMRFKESATQSNESEGSLKSESITLKATKKARDKLRQEETVKTVIAEDGDKSDSIEKPETKIDLYHCQLCEGPTYTSPTELNDHLKMVHPEQIHTCEQCPKVFMSEQAFQQHQYCHAIGRTHFCFFCDKGFLTEDLLKGHVRTHTHRTDYLCFLCGKEFSNNSNLRQHVKRHYGEKPWTCDQCPMRFSTKGYLTRHYQTHTKIKKFTCDTCGSLFSRQYTLVKHQLIHTGARFFSCEVCKMSFTSSDHVKRHMRTHTGEKPYKCGCCGRAFAQSNDMVKHMRTHLGENAYQCDRCDASYRLISELRNHYKEHYQPGENANGCSSTEEEKEIRFTSMSILNRLFDKKPMQCND